MNKEVFLEYTENNFNGPSKELVKKQINYFYDCLENFKLEETNYKIGDKVLLKKGTLLHGTFRNLDGLKDIVKMGLIASWFIDGRISKYPSSIGVWNLKQDYLLSDYINFYSGGTIKYSGLLIDNKYSDQIKTSVIPYNEMNDIMNIVKNNPSRMWYIEQTKEARFMPSLIQDEVQIGVIFNGNNEYVNKLKNNDILSENINDEIVKDFVNEKFYLDFINLRKNKDDFFTDRESAILFGIPSCLIEGILVGRKYEKNNNILNEIKQLLPNCYICNLDGIVIL